jgi:hypothetical protein
MGERQLERLRKEGVPLRGDRVDFILSRMRWDEHRARLLGMEPAICSE